MLTKIFYFWSKFFKKIRGSSILNSQIHKTSKIEAGSTIVNCSIGKYSSSGYDCKFVNTDIGSFCSIASNVCIGDSMHPIDWVSTSSVFYDVNDSIKKKFSKHAFSDVKRTIIGSDVWIGQNVLVKQGVVIGTGSIVGMGSVVTKDIPPYSIFGGNPARLIRYRFPVETIDKLLETTWWELDDDKIVSLAVDFNSPEELIKKI
ncbi:CatB-related O-acetyltransferase [Flavobacterium sp. Root420]|uniref:CatB-related O-acetyltransferase n=1 Tax=Flavobacterium sp. Root420 TaxID=1736533 RepID=UPI0006F8F9E6|nr:CatB-related O-acetyltransferase [Flavobacterium sp. Root420]KQW97673.1 glycosyl transferase family 1 [Flavobacterium sp. Root420]